MTLIRSLIARIPAPNRIAVYVGGAASLLGGLAPVVAGLDLTSTVGVLAGVGGLVAVIRKFLDGWQAYERALYTDELGQRELVRQAEMIGEATRPQPARGALNLPR